MEIKGLDHLTDEEIRLELGRGARFVQYVWAVSAVVVSFRRPSAIFFVKAGESRFLKGLPYILISFFFGWWGFPWGLIYTPMCIYRNCAGGHDVTNDVLAALQQQGAHVPPPLPT